MLLIQFLFTLAAESMTSADLLELIKSGKQDFNLKNATFSTVSIGYNDIMVPIVNVIGEAVLVDVRHTEDIIGAIQTKAFFCIKGTIRNLFKKYKDRFK